jgi:hypothetical protein
MGREDQRHSMRGQDARDTQGRDALATAKTITNPCPRG